MKLGILLPLGSSLKEQEKSGQRSRFTDYYLDKYRREFNQVYVFSYKDEKAKLFENCLLIPNKYQLPRFLYAFCLPFIHRQMIKKVDVLRVMQMPGAIPALIAKLFFKKPFIVTYGYDYVQFARLEGQKIRPVFLKLLEKIVLNQAEGVIVTTKQIKSRLKKKCPLVKLIYLPNGVDINKFKSLSSPLAPPGGNRGRAKARGSRFKVLFVGRLERQKNLESLVKAVSLLSREHKIKLLFIGQGRQKSQLIKLAEKKGVDLKIIDRLPHDQLVEYYHQADIFCLPSLAEGQPKVLLESMACGLPCLVARKPWSKEFRDKEEVLKTEIGFKDISRNLKALIKNQGLRERLSIQAREKVEKEFDINKLLVKEIKCLKKIG